jgi:DNA-binding NarL/FixJ family response regulator
MSPRILLADDHALVRDGLRAILEVHGYEVVAEACDGRDAVSEALRTKPDVVVMDVRMPHLNGIDATRQLVLQRPGIRVIGVSGYSDERNVIEMFEAGAKGYLLKGASGEELVEAVRAVSEGLDYVSPSVASVLVGRISSPGEDPRVESPLTLREREVLQLLAEGKTSKEIAGFLGVAVATVDTHRRRIMEKLDLHTIAELTKYAVRVGLTSLER